MPLPMVIAYHLIWTGYGWWLPNDLRGSTSRFIASDPLAELGKIHFGRKRIQPARRELLAFFGQAHERLDFPALSFDDVAIDAIARGFARDIADRSYTCYACAILPDHVHLAIRKHRDSAEEMIAHLQRESHLALRESGWIDLQHPVWGGHGWKVFPDHPDDIRRSNRYVVENPIPCRLPIQRWTFVKEYDGWPLHPGHSPNSPYTRRLREANR